MKSWKIIRKCLFCYRPSWPLFSKQPFICSHKSYISSALPDFWTHPFCYSQFPWTLFLSRQISFSFLYLPFPLYPVHGLSHLWEYTGCLVIPVTKLWRLRAFFQQKSESLVHIYISFLWHYVLHDKAPFSSVLWFTFPCVDTARSKISLYITFLVF